MQEKEDCGINIFQFTGSARRSYKWIKQLIVSLADKRPTYTHAKTTMPTAKMSALAATLYMGNMLHTRLGVRGVFGRGRAFDGVSKLSMKGKIVLVTGGTGGIGRAAAAQLARMGAEVHICGRNEERGQAAAKEMSGHACTLSPRRPTLRATRDFAPVFKVMFLAIVLSLFL